MSGLPENHPGEVLAKLALGLGLDEGVWALGETCDVAEVGELAVAPDVLDDAFFATLNVVRDTFGAALRLKLEATPVQYLGADDLADSGRVSEFRAELAELAGEVSVWFRLDKSAWIRSKLPDAAEGAHVPRVCWFLHARSVEELFGRGLREVEKALFTGSDRVVLLTPESGVDLRGDHLSIRAWSPVATQLEPAPMPISCGRMQHRVRWHRPYLEVVTPFHFALQGDDPNGVLSGQLARLFLTSFVMFTADITNGSTALHSSYVGATGTVEFDHRMLASVDLDRADLSAAVRHLAELLEWIYCEERLETDRLAYAQTLLVGELQPLPADERWSSLVRLSERLKTLTIRRWKTFIEDKLHAHESVVREHVRAVEAAADRYQDEVGDLVRSLSGAAVGGATVFVGTWIAMIGKIDVSADFLRVVVAVYAVYLAVFPLGLKSLAARSQAALIEQKFQKRRERVAAVLGDTEVDQIETGIIAPARRLFGRWWKASLLVNVILIAASVAGAYYAPALL